MKCTDHIIIVKPFYGSVGEGFRHGKTDRYFMIVLKDITVLNIDTEINYSREPNKDNFGI